MKRWRRIARILLIVVGGLAALIAAAVWWLNSYVESRRFSDRVHAAAIALTGVPADFEEIELDPRRASIRIKPWKLVHPVAGSQPSKFEAGSLELLARVKFLWRGKIEVNRVEAYQPVLTISRGPSGVFVLPLELDRTALSAATRGEGEAADMPAGAPTGSGGSSAAHNKPFPAFSVNLKSFQLQGGSLFVKNENGSPRLEGYNIDLNANIAEDDLENFTANGTVKFQETIFNGGIHVTNLQSPFTYQYGALALSNFEGKAYLGTVSGNFSQGIADGKYPYTFEINGTGMDTNTLIAQSFGRLGTVSGRCDLRAKFTGTAIDPKSLDAQGTVLFSNGQLVNVPIFRQIGKFVALSMVEQPDFSRISVAFVAKGTHVALADIDLKSALMSISGSGWMRYDKSCEFKVTLTLRPEVVEQLSTDLQNKMVKLSDGNSALALLVEGTYDDPKVSLAPASAIKPAR